MFDPQNRGCWRLGNARKVKVFSFLAPTRHVIAPAEQILRCRYSLGEADEEANVPAGLAAFVESHPATTEEIRTLLKDLQVLGRSEFKALLKW